MTGTLHENPYTIMISRSFLLKTRDVSEKSVDKVKHTFYVQRLFSKIVSFASKGRKILKSGAGHMTIWRMCIACWITKATDTHSNYVIFIGFTRQKWLRERASMLPFIPYIACLVFWYIALSGFGVGLVSNKI
jgi:hypothetical protein